MLTFGGTANLISELLSDVAQSTVDNFLILLIRILFIFVYYLLCDQNVIHQRTMAAEE